MIQEPALYVTGPIIQIDLARLTTDLTADS